MNQRLCLTVTAIVSFALAVSCATQPPALPPSSLSPADQITVAPPQIPDKTFLLTDYGGNGDGKTFNTDAFKKAIKAVAAAGGGHLVIPAGIYLTKPIVLTSHLDFHFSPGATIQASGNFADYDIRDPNLPSTQPGVQLTNEGVLPRQRRGQPTTKSANGASGRRVNRLPRLPALISCDGKTDIAITGPGVIDGAGRIFWAWSDKAARLYPGNRNVVPRPDLLNISNAERLHIDGITLTNSAAAHVTAKGNNILIEHMRVCAPSDAPNSDALRLTGENVIVQNCEFDIGDDNIAIGTPSHNVLIQDITCLHGHGISVGSFTEFGLDHVFIRRCNFDGTDNGLRIKSFRGGGGQVHDIWYSDISMKNVRRPFDVNCRYDGNANTQVDVGPREFDNDAGENIPDFYDIHVTNLTVVNSPIAGRIIGIPESPPEKFTFTNCKFQSVRGFYVEDAKQIVFDGVQMDAAIGEPLVTQNKTDVIWNGAPKTGQGPSAPFYWGN
jgi:polygalacturonase